MFHQCPLRESGQLRYFRPPPFEDVRVRMETDRQMRDYVDQQHPGAVLVLGTARQFMGDIWQGPANLVVIAVCDPSNVTASGALVLAFVIGGILPKGTSLPADHLADSGCIPFDMVGVWADARNDLPRRN